MLPHPTPTPKGNWYGHVAQRATLLPRGPQQSPRHFTPPGQQGTDKLLILLAGAAGFEPATLRLEGGCSGPLSYAPAASILRRRGGGPHGAAATRCARRPRGQRGASGGGAAGNAGERGQRRAGSGARRERSGPWRDGWSCLGRRCLWPRRYWAPLPAAAASAARIWASAPWKPQVLWLPSQKGLLLEWPQRQREMAGLLMGISCPLESIRVNSPSTWSEPLRRMVILTSGIRQQCKPRLRIAA